MKQFEKVSPPSRFFNLGCLKILAFLNGLVYENTEEVDCASASCRASTLSCCFRLSSTIRFFSGVTYCSVGDKGS